MPRLTTEQKNNYKRYLIDCIEYPEFACATNDYLIVDRFFKIFKDEYSFEIKRQGEFYALAEYMQNQPSSITLPSYHHEQIELAKSFGSIPQDATEKQEQKIIDNFYIFFANYMLQLKRTYKIEVYN